MAVNRIEPNVLTLHDDKGNTFQIVTSKEDSLIGDNSIKFKILDSAETLFWECEAKKDQVCTIVNALSYWVESGRLDFQDKQRQTEVYVQPHEVIREESNG